ncbi:MAG: hypothetical protein R2752_03115 [Vicinamibacterales bacterium]
MAALTAVTAVAAAAQNYDEDRTTFTFDSPVMVPGTTLPPGTYTFRLADTASNREIIEILKGDAAPVAIAHAIPTVRPEMTSDVVLLLNPTGNAEPPAVKTWFYPGELYGHEFVYPDAEARQIAQRTKTLVLSGDTSGQTADAGSATLFRIDADGAHQAWQPDEAQMRDWQQWYRSRNAEAMVAAPARTKAERRSTAPMMKADVEGSRLPLDDLEDNPTRYLGRTVTVTGEVDDVFGPQLFKIDEPDWADLGGEMLVYVPGNLAALVRQDDRVTVSGTVRHLTQDELGQGTAWLEDAGGPEGVFASRPAIVADRIVGGDSDVALTIDVPEGTAGAGHGAMMSGASGGTEPMTDAAAVVTGGSAMVGRRVKLEDVQVDRPGAHRGFWVISHGARLLVLPSRRPDTGLTMPSAGQSVTLEGTVLALPRGMRDAARSAGHGNEHIYIYATTIK